MTRKIDKRACRKFALPELEFNLNESTVYKGLHRVGI